MFSFLREAAENGKPGPLSMRRIAALFCLMTAIGLGIFALVIIFRFISSNPTTTGTMDWKAFIPLFFPSLSFLVGMLILLFFTTWEDLKELVVAASGFKKS